MALAASKSGLMMKRQVLLSGWFTFLSESMNFYLILADSGSFSMTKESTLSRVRSKYTVLLSGFSSKYLMNYF